LCAHSARSEAADGHSSCSLGIEAKGSAMIKTHGLSHIALSVLDPERSLRFYRSVFGVREYFRDETTIQVMGPDPHEVIALEKRPASAGTADGIIHLGFRLTKPEDIGAAIAAVEAAGGTLSSQGSFGVGLPYAFVRDPDGYEIEIWFEQAVFDA
jgi:catechol 2,3-dioxygenase-like lactoylglutathione lyase family enzyme